MGLPENIKKFRKEKNMTQKDLAEKAGLSIASIQGYEQGKYKPKVEQLKKISKALEVSMSDIDSGRITSIEIPAVRNNAHNLCEAMGKVLGSERSFSDILHDQLIQQIILRNILPEDEYNYLLKKQAELPIHSHSYKTKTLDIAKDLNEEGWKELLQYTKYLATNPKYRNNDDTHDSTEKK